MSARPQSPNTDQPPRDQHKTRLTIRVGIGLILLSGVFWFSLFAVPFLPLTLGQKAALGGGLFAAVQVAWWCGAALAGPAAVARLWSWWGRKAKTEQT